MLRENLKDAATILSNILSQSLEISGATANVSLLEALKNFDPQKPLESDLQKILREFVRYPEPTQALIQELELLAQDLSV
ncbi:MAG: hypothetical protein K2P51_08080 [Rhabdochlamydiaceae bacterium]|nr:hypothetical protein [Rhabdochlamydiaceae bacterium]